jgi:hypothetical protein
VLTLVGGVFALVLLYAGIAVGTLALALRRRMRGVNARFAPDVIFPGEETLAVVERADAPGCIIGNIREAPAVLVRYCVALATRDGRDARRALPREVWKQGMAPMRVFKRGAYYGATDEVVIADIFGFVKFVFELPAGEGVRLCVAPAPAGGDAPFLAFSGGDARRREQAVVRTDDLIEQRPYVPGDDPRRINWKLYGHAGALFVREENREPPPHSILTLLLYAAADESVFPAARFGDGRAQDAVDALCEAALAIAGRTLAEGGAVFLGAAGSAVEEIAGTEALTSALAMPFALPARAASQQMPPALPAPAAGSVMILALPEPRAGTVARFIAEKPATQSVSVLFVYRDAALSQAAIQSAARWAGRPDVRTAAIHF